MGRVVCIKCGSSDLERQFEIHSLMSCKIKSDGKFSKIKKYIRDVSYSEPEWIKCNGCNSEFDYGIDEKGCVELYFER